MSDIDRKTIDDFVSRQTVLQCIKESREDIDWGQSEDGDALYRTMASKECLPSADVEPVTHCRDCIFGHKCIDIINGTITAIWVECGNPDGLNRDVPLDGYCYAGIEDDEERMNEK